MGVEAGPADAGSRTLSPHAPYLLTSLTSNNARAPIALSIRKSATTTIASIAYTFNLRRGWSVGIQDIHVTPPTPGSSSTADVSSSLIAYTEPPPNGTSLVILRRSAFVSSRRARNST